MTKEAIARGPSGRVRRTPVGRRNVLTVSGKDPDYVYRIVNDEGNRIEMFREAGYETVEAATHSVGDRRVESASPEGSIATAYVGSGRKGVVMRIRKEWYQEDQEAKERQLSEVEEGTRPENIDGFYGKSNRKVKYNEG